MCFSAHASFIAAGVTGLIGIACFTKTETPRDWPLAAMPLLFSAQQAVEGLLWLTLPAAPHQAQASMLTLVFLLFAKVFWPVYVPTTVLLIEPDSTRRAIMRAILLGGIAIAAYFLYVILNIRHEASILGQHIVYEAPQDFPWSVAALYLAATCAAPLLSSHRTVQLLACIVITGATITYAYYWDAFTSIWCFFAAAGSAVIYLHFVEEKRARAMPPLA